MEAAAFWPVTSDVASVAVSTSGLASAATTSSDSVGFASSLAKRLWKDEANHCFLDTKAGRAAVMMERCWDSRVVEGFAATALKAARLRRNLYAKVSECSQLRKMKHCNAHVLITEGWNGWN